MTLFDYPFMINALRAGTIVAVVSGAMGWFMVLRRQTFAGHTLSLIGFPGAAGAILLGLSPAFGYFGFCLAAGVIIAREAGAHVIDLDGTEHHGGSTATIAVAPGIRDELLDAIRRQAAPPADTAFTKERAC